MVTMCVRVCVCVCVYVCFKWPKQQTELTIFTSRQRTQLVDNDGEVIKENTFCNWNYF